MGRSKFSVIQTEKTVSDSLADIRRLMKGWGVEDFEPIPGEDGRSYAVRYLRGGVWTEIRSRLQPTKAHNARQVLQVMQYLKLWGERGIEGRAPGGSFVGGLVPTKPARDESFDEACATLGVEPTASMEEVERVWRVKVQFAHPDKGGDAERFKRIQKAYELIARVKGTKTEGAK